MRWQNTINWGPLIANSKFPTVAFSSVCPTFEKSPLTSVYTISSILIVSLRWTYTHMGTSWILSSVQFPHMRAFMWKIWQSISGKSKLHIFSHHIGGIDVWLSLKHRTNCVDAPHRGSASELLSALYGSWERSHILKQWSQTHLSATMCVCHFVRADKITIGPALLTTLVSRFGKRLRTSLLLLIFTRRAKCKNGMDRVPL